MKVLVVDDELSVRLYLEQVLLRDLEFVSVVQADSLTAARAVLADGDVDVVLIDLHLDHTAEDGLVLVKEVRESFRAVPIVVSGSQDHAAVRDAMKCGAWDYVVKEEIAERVAPLLRNLHQHQELEQEVRVLRARRDQPIAGLVGSSDAMQKLRADLARVAKSDRAVLVRGETGSGKELVARAVHDLSSRSSELFLALNCGALPDALVESELFGHERGAFTGAIKDRPGRFELAEGGTIFLDDIDDVPLSMQVKLLRVLQNRTVERLGGTRTVPVNVRIIAGSKRDLKSLVNEGKFRDDLFYRLNVIPINLPPLRERPEDIPVLMDHFLRRFFRRKNEDVPPVSDAVMQAFTRYNWPGNVRELENACERIAQTCTCGTVRVGCVSASILFRAGAHPSEPGILLGGQLATFIQASGSHRFRENPQ